MIITVVGLGKIGLPLAVQYAGKGHRVIGADVNPRVIEAVSAGDEPFPGETDLAARLKQVVNSGMLTATMNTREAVEQSNAVVIVVPLYVDALGQPDFGWMDEATEAVGAGLQPGALVSYETTLPVGTTRSRFVPALEAKSGMKCGADFFVVFSPERVLTGRVFSDLQKYPKLVGGIDATSEAKGIEFYEQVLDFQPRPDLKTQNGVWGMGSAEASEMAKLAETTYRDVNIALANQFALWAERHGIDIHKVIDASNSQPFSHVHRPGVAVGGHCIPVYPRFYLWNDPDATVVEAARRANAAMPKRVVSMLEELHGSLKGQRVAILGAAYRGGVKETAFSGVFPVFAALSARGAIAVVHDPLYSDAELIELGLPPYHFHEPVDAAVVQADHPDYAELDETRLPGIRTLVDGRHCTTRENWPSVTYHDLGVADI